MPSKEEQLILPRLLLVKEALKQGTKDYQDLTAIEKILCIQQLDFAIDTLLKTVVSAFGPPSAYTGRPTDYFLKIDTLKRERYDPRRSNFYRLYDEVVGIYNDPSKGISKERLPLKNEIDRLRKVRDAAQHEWVIPDPSTLTELSQHASIFIVSMMKDAFKQEFKDLRSAVLIVDKSTREFYAKAEEYFEKRKYRKSVINARKAFDRAEHLVRESKVDRFWIRSYSSSDYGGKVPRELSSQVESLTRGLGDLNEKLDLLMLGIEQNDLQRFLNITSRSTPSSLTPFLTDPEPLFTPSKEQCHFVLNFVFDNLLRWKI